MKAMFSWILSIWKIYWNEGFYQYLLLVSVIYLLICKRKKAGARQALPFLFAMLFVFFCPFTAWLIRACIGESVYWRVLWLIPLIPVIALGATEFIRDRKSKLAQVILLLIFTGVIALSGKSVMQAGNYIRLANHQKVPNEVAYVCELMQEKAREENLTKLRVASDDYISAYIRVYDPTILMPYGRWAKGSLDYKADSLHKHINSAMPNYKSVGKRAKQTHCNFLILPETSQDPHEALAKYGFNEIATAGSYTVYYREIADYKADS